MPHTTGEVLKLAALVLSLGFDTFAVAVGLGVSGLERRERLRFGVTFALFEGIMPLIGFILGGLLAAAIGRVADYLAIALLFAVGLYAIWEATHEEEEREYDATSLAKLAALGISVSLDELAVGFGLGLLHIAIVLAVLLIAAQAFAVTLLGTALGHRLGEEIGERAELVSGVVLTLLALALFVQHVL